jgi:hypothetical protein
LSFKQWGPFGATHAAKTSSSCHSPAFVDKSVADRQAHSLEKVLTEEHEREKNHADRIELPD